MFRGFCLLVCWPLALFEFQKKKGFIANNIIEGAEYIKFHMSNLLTSFHWHQVLSCACTGATIKQRGNLPPKFFKNCNFIFNYF